MVPLKQLGRLMVITDETFQDRFSHEKLAALAITGGAGLIQYRDKKAATGNMIQKAIVLKRICSEHRVPLIVNDRVDVAMASAADGVHLGREDLPVKAARELLGPDRIIGGTAGTLDSAPVVVNEALERVLKFDPVELVFCQDSVNQRAKRWIGESRVWFPALAGSLLLVGKPLPRLLDLRGKYGVRSEVLERALAVQPCPGGPVVKTNEYPPDRFHDRLGQCLP